MRSPLLFVAIVVSLARHSTALVEPDAPVECAGPIAPITNDVTDADVANACNCNCSVSRATVSARAWEFAPIVFMHRLEKYRLDDPKRFLAAASIFERENGTNLGAATERNLLEMTRKYNATPSVLYLSAYDTDFDYSGMPFDETTGSTAPIYFHLAENSTSRTFVFNYHMWYSYNGCSNQALDYSAFEPDTRYIFQYVMCHVGTHEGDWEHIQVEVCRDLKTIVRIVIDAHGFNQVFNCLVGDCEFMLRNGTHPITYAGLDSHGSYVVSAQSHIYAQVNLAVIANLNNINILDRTIADPTLVFQPTSSNVLELLSPWEYEAQVDAILSDPNEPTEQYQNTTFGYYQGDWGLAKQQIPLYPELEQISWDCYNFNQTILSHEGCSESYWYTATKTIWNGLILGVSVLPKELEDQLKDAVGEALGPDKGPSGPNGKDFFNVRESARPAPPFDPSTPNWNASFVYDCPAPGQLVAGEPDFVTYTGFSPDMIAGTTLILGCVFCVIVALLVIVYCVRLKKRRESRKESPDNQPFLTQLAYALLAHWPITGTVAFLISAIGFATLLVGFQQLFDTLEMVLGYIALLDTLQKLMITFAFCALLMDAIVFLFAIFGDVDLFMAVCVRSRDKKLRKSGTIFKKIARCLTIFATILICMANIVSLLFFAMGLIALGIQFAVNAFCDVTSFVQGGICIDLSFLGIRTILCGWDLALTCTRITNIDSSRIIVGTVFYSVGQMLFLILCGILLVRYGLLNAPEPNDESSELSGAARTTDELLADEYAQSKLHEHSLGALRDTNQSVAESLV